MYDELASEYLEKSDTMKRKFQELLLLDSTVSKCYLVLSQILANAYCCHAPRQSVCLPLLAIQLCITAMHINLLIHINPYPLKLSL